VLFEVKEGQYLVYPKNPTEVIGVGIAGQSGITSFATARAACNQLAACIGMSYDDTSKWRLFGGRLWEDAVGKVKTVGESIASWLDPPTGTEQPPEWTSCQSPSMNITRNGSADAGAAGGGGGGVRRLQEDWRPEQQQQQQEQQEQRRQQLAGASAAVAAFEEAAEAAEAAAEAAAAEAAAAEAEAAPAASRLPEWRLRRRREAAASH
jgi:hypothetical protein